MYTYVYYNLCYVCLFHGLKKFWHKSKELQARKEMVFTVVTYSVVESLYWAMAAGLWKVCILSSKFSRLMFTMGSDQVDGRVLLTEFGTILVF